MANHGKAASKHEYNKPRLKEQIDAAMQAFLKSGKAVERIPTVLVPEPLAPAKTEGEGAATESEEPETDHDTDPDTVVEAAPEAAPEAE